MGTTLREIKEDDLEMIMNWRMDPDVTKYMNTNPKLTLEGQKKWLSSLQNDDNVQYWVIESDGIPVGLINLADIDWKEKTSSWRYYIGEKKFRTLKLAISLEMSLYDYVFDVLGFTELHNEVLSLNEGVVKLHIACGSHVVKEVQAEVEKEGVRYDVTHVSITNDKWNSIRNNKKYEKINFDIYFKPHHIGVAVADIAASVCKYNKIGYYQNSEMVVDKHRNVYITFMENRADGSVIELIAPASDKSPVSELLKHKKNVSTLYHICYEVGDIERAMDMLKKRGFMATTKVEPALAFDNRRVVFMLCKEVGLIELVEEKQG